MTKMILSLAAVALLQVTLVAAILPPNYQDRSAAEKQTFLWNQLLFDPYTTLPVGGHGPLQMANVVVPTYHTVAFNRPSDEMVTGRKKLLHPYGSCAKADFKIHANSQYTGVFQVRRFKKYIRIIRFLNCLASWIKSTTINTKACRFIPIEYQFQYCPIRDNEFVVHNTEWMFSNRMCFNLILNTYMS